IAGLEVSTLSLLVPMYQSKIFDIPSIYQLFIAIRIFVVTCTNYRTEARNSSGSWQIPMGISFLWVFLLGIGILFFSESPRYEDHPGRI
ncbi:hypothetical protein BGZ60DRAFT_367430, partial [Tricladium varicosporioides]